jgi:hypothetical protein
MSSFVKHSIVRRLKAGVKIGTIVIAAVIAATPAMSVEMTIHEAEAVIAANGSAKLCTMTWAFVAFKIAPVTEATVAQSVDECRCLWSEAYNLPKPGQGMSFIDAAKWATGVAEKAKAGSLLDTDVAIKLFAISKEDAAACRARHLK